jgi:hypothetical protein
MSNGKNEILFEGQLDNSGKRTRRDFKGSVLMKDNSAFLALVADSILLNVTWRHVTRRTEQRTTWAVALASFLKVEISL